MTNDNLLIVLDRDRDCNYNGDLLRLNTYQCETCRKVHVRETDYKIVFCCYCGVKFSGTEDYSV